MTIDIWFGQFNIVNGEAMEEGPFVGIFEGSRAAAGVGVYVVAEPVGGATARLCTEVLDVIAGAFGSPESALTANLLRAVGAAHQHVREWNRVHGAERLAGVGVSCLATRGDEAYLAQCGSALAVARAGGRFRVAAPAGDDSRRPLGMGERAAPVFTRFTLSPGDVVMLTFSAADQLVDRGTLSSLVSAPPEEAMPALFVRVRSRESFGALYLTALAAAPPLVAPTSPAAGQANHSSEVEPGPAPRMPHATFPSRRAPGLPPEQEPERGAPSRERNGYPPETRAGPLMAEASARARAARRAALGALGGERRLPSRRVLLLLAAIAAFALLLWLVVPALARRGTDDRYHELLHAADTAVAGAEAEADPARRRTLLTRAEADLLDARTIHPQSGEVTERLSHIGAALASLDGARELTDLTQVADLSAAGVAPQSPVQMVFADRAYLLDVSSGKVLSFGGRPGERPDVVLEEGRAAGPERVGKPRHLAVAPGGAGRPPTLLVLDANRRLFALAPDGSWRSVPLGGTDTWKSDTAIAVTSSGLYVLDAMSEQVWRHIGTAAGFDGKPEPLVARAPLREGVSLSIIGVPIVATSDSRLLRILDGHEEELRPAALDRPLVAPSAPLFNPVDALLYVADRGNQRIVLLDAAGNFHGQLSNRKLVALRAIALDESHGVLYAVSGQTLMSAPLPK